MQKNSGPSVRIYNLATQLASLGNNVEVIIPQNVTSTSYAEGVKINGLKGFLPTPMLNVLRRFIHVSRATSLYFYDIFFIIKCSRFLKKADVVQIEQQTAGSLFIPFIKYVLKKPVILDCHDIFQALRLEHISLSRRFLETTLERMAYKFADLMLVVSEKEQKSLALMSVNPKNIRVIPNGVNTTNFSNNTEKKLTGKFSIDDSHVVVFVGNLRYHPNRVAIELLSTTVAPEVINSTKNVKFLVVGDNSDTPNLPNLVFTGLVDNVADVLSFSDVAVAPLFSGTGTRLKILEYLSSGLPVVSTTIGAEGLEISDGINIIIQDDIDKFSTAIIELLNDKERREKIGKAARNIAVSRYDWYIISKKLNNSLKELLPVTSLPHNSQACLQ